MKELLKKIHLIEIRIRKAITSQMQGDFHSVFKGSGLEFEDVRAYQYGDDVRTIDWNVSAKGHGTFVKTFKEEKEQSVFFLLDMSASQEIGSGNKRKMDIGKEVAGVLALSAVKEGSQIGFIGFSDERELYIKPGKGPNFAYRLITELFRYVPKSTKTDLGKALVLANTLIKRRSIVIFISDFIDEGYEQGLKSLAKKHDVVLIHLHDKKESELPALGIVPIVDKESGKTHWVNSSSAEFQSQVAHYFTDNTNHLKTLARKINAEYVDIQTQEDYVPKLIKLFTIKNKKGRGGK